MSTSLLERNRASWFGRERAIRLLAGALCTAQQNRRVAITCSP
jgi:hypothetical protein